MNWIDYVSSQPTSEPVTVQDFKDFNRITHNEDDSLILRTLKASRKWCEDYQHRAYVTQTRVMKMDGFPCGPIENLRAPLASVSSIAYIDSAGSSQTWSSAYYQVDTASIPPRVLPTYDQTYPATQTGTVNTVTITYVCGSAVSSVSELAKEAILRMARNLYEGCGMEAAADMQVQQMLDIERTWVPV